MSLNFTKNSAIVESLDGCIPGTKSDAQDQVRQDFGRSNSRLESLSALYFRYFSQIELSIEDLAKMPMWYHNNFAAV